MKGQIMWAEKPNSIPPTALGLAFLFNQKHLPLPLSFILPSSGDCCFLFSPVPTTLSPFSEWPWIYPQVLYNLVTQQSCLPEQHNPNLLPEGFLRPKTDRGLGPPQRHLCHLTFAYDQAHSQGSMHQGWRRKPGRLCPYRICS